jgi:hypothetical protein
MSTKRTPIARHPAPRITPRALDLFERGKRLKARGKEEREFSEVSYALDVELQQKPWQESALDVDTDEPPAYMRTPAEIADYRRARAIRLELEAALRARRKAQREAKRAQNAATDATPPPAS